MAKKATKKTAVKVVKKKAKKATKKAAKETTPPEQELVVGKHRLVPKHEILKESQLTKLYEEFQVQPTNIPTILITDASLQGLDIKMGDILKITRTSPTAGTTFYYRRVSYE